MKNILRKYFDRKIIIIGVVTFVCIMLLFQISNGGFNSLWNQIEDMEFLGNNNSKDSAILFQNFEDTASIIKTWKSDEALSFSKGKTGKAICILNKTFKDNIIRIDIPIEKIKTAVIGFSAYIKSEGIKNK